MTEFSCHCPALVCWSFRRFRKPSSSTLLTKLGPSLVCDIEIIFCITGANSALIIQPRACLFTRHLSWEIYWLLNTVRACCHWRTTDHEFRVLIYWEHFPSLFPSTSTSILASCKNCSRWCILNWNKFLSIYFSCLRIERCSWHIIRHALWKLNFSFFSKSIL